MNPVGDDFQRETKYYRDRMTGGGLDFSSQPEPYKRYPDAKLVDLPFVGDPGGLALHETLRRRRSIRRFSGEPLDRTQLAWLLWASTGITRVEGGYEFRAAPSAGALYPIETYLCINRVDGIDPGIYHYAIQQHKLETIREGDFATDVTAAALDQSMCAQAAVVFLWTAIFQRSKWKYRQRAHRYVYMDAGHIAENLALAATSIGLASCHIAALYDDEANDILGVDGTEESVIYMTVVGKPI